MKKILILFCLLFILLLVPSREISAQTYHPFPTGYAFWVDAAGYYPNFSDVEYAVMNGDTEINGLIYQKIYTSQYDTDYAPFLSYFLREDSNKQIYLLGNSVYPYPEYHLYDFNLSVGDTFSYVGSSVNDTFPAVVTKIDTISTLVDYRRRFKIQSANYNFPLWGYQDDDHYWIEGIGSNLGLGGYTAAPYNVPAEAPHFQELCFWENGEYILESSYGCFFTGLGKVDGMNFIFSISPNPVHDFATIISPAFLQRKLIVEVITTEGKVVFRKTFFNQLQNNISTTDLPVGYYLIKVLDMGNNSLFISPFLKQD